MSLNILDGTTGKTLQTIGPNNDFENTSATAANDKKLYVWNKKKSNTGGSLYIFSGLPASAATIFGSNLSGPPVSSMAFGRDGVLYTQVQGSRDLLALDRNNGFKATVVCPRIFPPGRISGMAMDPNTGLLYGVEASTTTSISQDNTVTTTARLYTIDPIKCVFTRVCTMELPSQKDALNEGPQSIVWYPPTNMFLASMPYKVLFDLDIDCTISNIRATQDSTPSGMAMYEDVPFATPPEITDSPSQTTPMPTNDNTDIVPTFMPSVVSTPTPVPMQIPNSNTWVYAVDARTEILYILDMVTGQVLQTVGERFSGYTTPGSMVVAQKNGKRLLYVYNNTPQPGLIQVDPATGEVTPFPLPPNNERNKVAGGIVMGINNVLYGKFQTSRHLWSYDPDDDHTSQQQFSTIVCENVFPSYFRSAGMEADPTTGLLYSVQLTAFGDTTVQPEVLTIDPVACTATLVGTLSEDVGVVGAVMWNPMTNKFLGSSTRTGGSGFLFDLDKNGTVSNIRNVTSGYHPHGMVYYFDPDTEADDDDDDNTPTAKPNTAPIMPPTTMPSGFETIPPTSTTIPTMGLSTVPNTPPTMAPTTMPSAFETLPPTPSTVSTRCTVVNSYKGQVVDGKCYALDILYCITSDFTGVGCMQVKSTFEYYNQRTNSVGTTIRTRYAVFDVFANYNCGDAIPDRCDIVVGGMRCNYCSNSGRVVTMMDCSNIPDEVMKFKFFPSVQTISLVAGGGHFRINATDDMCNHPSVLSVSDRSFVTEDEEAPVKKKKLDESAYSFVVPSELHFHFEDGKGMDLDLETQTLLMENTLEFFKESLPRVLEEVTSLSITVDDVKTVYSESMPDDVSVSFLTNVNLKSSSIITLRNTVEGMAGSDWNKYLDVYVHRNNGPHTEPKHSALDDIQKVVFRGVGREP